MSENHQKKDEKPTILQWGRPVSDISNSPVQNDYSPVLKGDKKSPYEDPISYAEAAKKDAIDKAINNASDTLNLNEITSLSAEDAEYILSRFKGKVIIMDKVKSLDLKTAKVLFASKSLKKISLLGLKVGRGFHKIATEMAKFESYEGEIECSEVVRGIIESRAGIHSVVADLPTISKEAIIVRDPVDNPELTNPAPSLEVPPPIPHIEAKKAPVDPKSLWDDGMWANEADTGAGASTEAAPPTFDDEVVPKKSVMPELPKRVEIPPAPSEPEPEEDDHDESVQADGEIRTIESAGAETLTLQADAIEPPDHIKELAGISTEPTAQELESEVKDIPGDEVPAVSEKPSSVEAPHAPEAPTPSAPETDPSRPNFPDSYTVEKAPEGAEVEKTESGTECIHKDGNYYPHHNGYIIKAVDGVEINTISSVYPLEFKDGKVYGPVWIEKSKWLILNGDHLIQEVDGEKIIGIANDEPLEFKDGKVSALVRTVDNKWIDLVNYDSTKNNPVPEDEPTVNEEPTAQELESEVKDIPGDEVPAVSEKPSSAEAPQAPQDPTPSEPETDPSRPNFPSSYTVEKAPEDAEVKTKASGTECVYIDGNIYPHHNGYIITAVDRVEIKNVSSDPKLEFKDGKAYGEIITKDNRRLILNGDHLIQEVDGVRVISAIYTEFKDGKVSGSVKTADDEWIDLVNYDGEKNNPEIPEDETSAPAEEPQEQAQENEASLSSLPSEDVDDSQWRPDPLDFSPITPPPRSYLFGDGAPANIDAFDARTTEQEAPLSEAPTDTQPEADPNRPNFPSSYTVEKTEEDEMVDNTESGTEYVHIDGNNYAHHNGYIITAVDGVEIRSIDGGIPLEIEDGKAYGRIYTKDERWLILNGDHLIQEVNGVKVKGIASNVPLKFKDGKVSGSVKTVDGNWIDLVNYDGTESEKQTLFSKATDLAKRVKNKVNPFTAKAGSDQTTSESQPPVAEATESVQESDPTTPSKAQGWTRGRVAKWAAGVAVLGGLAFGGRKAANEYFSAEKPAATAPDTAPKPVDENGVEIPSGHKIVFNSKAQKEDALKKGWIKRTSEGIASGEGWTLSKEDGKYVLIRN